MVINELTLEVFVCDKGIGIVVSFALLVEDVSDVSQDKEGATVCESVSL